MKTDHNIIEDAVKIPLDMMMDILNIILKEELKHEIINILPNRNMVTIQISYDKINQRAEKAVSSMHTLLTEYQHYRSWEDENVNWKEE